jgi:hypothetical protein
MSRHSSGFVEIIFLLLQQKMWEVLENIGKLWKMLFEKWNNPAEFLLKW